MNKLLLTSVVVMRSFVTLWLIIVASLTLGNMARGEDLLRFIPKEAQLALIVEQPRQLGEAMLAFDAYESAQVLPPVHEVLNSTNVRRFKQFVNYYEDELGAAWPELLDQIAGHGLAIGATFQDNGPVLLVAQGKDAETVARFYNLATKLLENEVARDADGQSAMNRGTIHGHATLHFGDDLHLAQVDDRIYISNKKLALIRGLALADGTKINRSLASQSSTAKGRQLLDGNPLAWLWIDFETVRQSTQGKQFFEGTQKDFLGNMVIGSSVNALSRAEFVAAGWYQNETGFQLQVRVPAKRAELPKQYALHVPMTVGVPGSLPLLKPDGVVYSQSFYLDLATSWKERKALFSNDVVQGIEKGVRDISKLLPGASMDQLLLMSGPHHRFVASVKSYGLAYEGALPEQFLPAMALVTSMRDSEFGNGMSSALRAAGFVATLQYKFTMHETEHDGIKIVSYRFPVNGKYLGDETNLRFNFHAELSRWWGTRLSWPVGLNSSLI